MTIEGLQAALKDGYVVVTREWFDLAIRALKGEHGCPFCGSRREPHKAEADEHKASRLGCLDCGEWFEPVRLKERGR